MRMLYLIRHAQPKAPRGPRRCVSKTDLPLDKTGVLEAQRLREWARSVPLTAVFSSPLQRSMHTARIMADERIRITIRDDLREMDVGAWENLTFDEIRARYPREYEARGEHPGSVPPPGGESFAVAGARLLTCLDFIMEQAQGSVAVVSHGGAIRGLLCRLLGLEADEVLSIRQPWGGITELRWDGQGQYNLLSVGRKPDRYPVAAAQEALLVSAQTPAAVREHCEAVARQALTLAAQLENTPVDIGLLRAACQLHDLLRHKGDNHAEQGAKQLDRDGYPELAAIVAAHHDLPPDSSIEAQLLYLADKLIRGTENVTLEGRFAATKEKCNTLQAMAAWQRRYETARAIVKRYHLQVGGRIA